jgi:spore maturation protein CgeB
VRVLLVHPGPHFSVSDVHDGLQKGLIANGVETASLNLHDRLDFYSGAHLKKGRKWVKAFEREDAIQVANQGLLSACYQFWPDIVVVMSGFFILPATWGILAKRPHHVVLWCTESPYEDDRQARQARYVDSVIMNDPTNLGSMRTVNPRTWHLGHAYDPAVHHPGSGRPELACDFGFVGTGFDSRIEFFESVDWTGIDARFGGNWTQCEEGSPIIERLLHPSEHCMDNAETADLYRSAKIGANVYRKEHSDGAHAAGWAIGPREVELAACGSFFLREPRAEGDALFPSLPTFTEPGDFGDKVRWWLRNPELREEAADTARAAVADRTFTNTAAKFLQLVDGAGKSAIAA